MNEIYILYTSSDFDGCGTPTVTSNTQRALDFINEPQQEDESAWVEKYAFIDGDWKFVSNHTRHHKSRLMKAL